MKVFLSWSGENSKSIARILYDWLPNVVQIAEPYFSPDDIAKGARWDSEIGRELAESRIGILCITNENLTAPWIMFEAGALSKALKTSKVCPLLFNVEPSSLVGPLASFQAAVFGKQEMERVVKMINAEAKEHELPRDRIESIFEKWWPDLQSQISSELGKPVLLSRRSERELLEEILEHTRSTVRRESELGNELRARISASLGYVLGEMSVEPQSLAPTDTQRLKESIRHSQLAWEEFRKIGGPAEMMALNNLLFYSALLGESSNRDFLLTQARRLYEAGQKHNVTNLTLTACRVILQFSPDTEERKQYLNVVEKLLKASLPEKERKEAQLCLDQFS